MPGGRPRRVLLLSLLVLAGHAVSRAEPSPSTESPAAHASVGRLWVPAIRYESGYARHYDEQCSGTLVRRATDREGSRLVVSAWHCVEDYRDLSRPMIFESAAGERREARLLAAGGAMDRDWAFLRLSAPLPHGSTLAFTDADTGAGTKVLMAGYPRTASPDIPKELVQARCAVTGHADKDRESDCVLRVGASGGGVFLDGPEPVFLGVISRGDGRSVSVFVPLERFRRNLQPYL